MSTSEKLCALALARGLRPRNGMTVMRQDQVEATSARLTPGSHMWRCAWHPAYFSEELIEVRPGDLAAFDGVRLTDGLCSRCTARLLQEIGPERETT